MELGLTIPLQRALKIRALPYGTETDAGFCWDLHRILLRGCPSLLAVHCRSRYAFTLFDLDGPAWATLPEAFLCGLRQTLWDIGISDAAAARYLQQAGRPQQTRTHGRREVAFLNRAWEDVLAVDFALNPAARDQPLLNHAVNARPSRCAGMDGLGTAGERLLQSLSGYMG